VMHNIASMLAFQATKNSDLVMIRSFASEQTMVTDLNSLFMTLNAATKIYRDVPIAKLPTRIGNLVPGKQYCHAATM
jgi:hypothetical protein